MTSLAYRLGRKAAPHLLRVEWLGASLLGSESARIRSERAMGSCLAREFRRTVTVVEKGGGTGTLKLVTERLAGRLTNGAQRFEVCAMQSPEANALAFPGGFIFVAHSLMDLCAFREDELAFLLAHEMAHVVRGHAARRFLSDAAVRVVARAACGTPASRALSAFLAKAVQQSYSQSQELEADRFAVHLVFSARFDPRAGGRLFEKLDRTGDQPSLLGSFFLSHPGFAERIKAVRDEVRRLPRVGSHHAEKGCGHEK